MALSPGHVPLHADGVDPVQNQGETHYGHHDGDGRDKITQRGRAGRGHFQCVSSGIEADLSIQHALTSKITLRGGTKKITCNANSKVMLLTSDHILRNFISYEPLGHETGARIS